MNEKLAQNVTYVILGFSSGFLFGFLWDIATFKIGTQHMAHQNGYHYHHSLFGLISFLLIPKLWGDINKALFAFGFGIGVILQHYLKDGFVFITKD